jgi:uncharacterized membrane protein YdjX (TVP38/TMEM64 family)
MLPKRSPDQTLACKTAPMLNPKALARAAVALAIGTGIVLAVAYRGELHIDRLQDRLDDYGAFIPLAYVLAHVAASLFFVPRTLMAVLAGLLFGKWGGPVWSLVGSMAGAYVGFAAARYVNGGHIRPEEMRRIGPYLKRAEASGWRMIAVIRGIPLPHTPLNFAFGVTRVGVRDYLLGSFVGFVPASIICAELGASGRYATAGTGNWLEVSAWAAAFVIASIALPRLATRWSRH